MGTTGPPLPPVDRVHIPKAQGTCQDLTLWLALTGGQRLNWSDRVVGRGRGRRSSPSAGGGADSSAPAQRVGGVRSGVGGHLVSTYRNERDGLRVSYRGGNADSLVCGGPRTRRASPLTDHLHGDLHWRPRRVLSHPRQRH